MLAWFVTLCVSIGSGLLAFGLRGRLIAAGPHCRRCGYDLAGLLGSDRGAPSCPECDAGLGGGHGVREGLRRRRRAAIALGVLLVLVGAGAPVVTYAAGKNATWYRQLAPLWWVMQEARGGSTDAAAELLRRMKLGAVPRTRDPQIERLLIKQVEAQTPLDGVWGDLLAHAVSTGVFTQAQRERLIRSSHTFTTHVRRLHRSGDRITFAIEGTPVYDRFLLSRLGVGEMGIDQADLYIGDEGLDPATPRRGVSLTTSFSGYPLPSPSGGNTRLSMSPSAPDGTIAGPLPVGEHRVSILFTPRYDDITLPMKHTHTIEIVPDDVPIVELAPYPPEQVQRLLDSFRIGPLRVFDPGDRAGRGSLGGVGLSYQIETPEIPLASEVLVRVDGEEFPIGEVAQTASAVSHASGRVSPERRLYPAPRLPADVTRVDVVFRASARAAERKSELERIWNGEVVFRNIPVERVGVAELYSWSSSACVHRPEGATPDAP